MRQQAQYLLMYVPIESISPRSTKHRTKVDQFDRDMLESDPAQYIDTYKWLDINIRQSPRNESIE